MKLTELPLNTKDDFTGWCSREASITPTKGKSVNDPYPVVITTDQPAIVVDWEEWRLVREVLLMEGMKIPATKQVTMLDTHTRFSTSQVKGSVRDISSNASQALGDVYFWAPDEKNGIKGAVEEWSKVDQGHLTDVSAGYRTSKDKTIELRPGETKEINGRTFTNNFNDGLPFLVRTEWDLKEVSLVPIGADDAAKFRSLHQPSIKSEDPELQKKLDEALEENKTLKSELNIKQRSNEMPDNNAPELTPDQIKKQERERVREIEGIAGSLISQKLYKGGKEELGKAKQKAIDDGTSIDAFRAQVWGNLKNEDIHETPVTDLGLSPKEVSNLSISRAIEAMLAVRGGDVMGWEKLKAGAEREAIDETIKRASSIPGIQLRGMPIPLDFFKNPEVMRHSNILKAAQRNMLRDAGVLSKRASDGISASDATYLIGTQNMFAEFIDVLRNIGVAGPWGVRMVSGAKQNISIPKRHQPEHSIGLLKAVPEQQPIL